MDRMLRISMAAALAGVLSSAGLATAQIDPEGGDVWVPPADDTGTTDTQTQQTQQQPWYQGGPTGQTPPPQTTNTTVQQSTTVVEQVQEQQDGRSDHARVAAGHAAVGFMGISLVPIGGTGSPAVNETISAPALGLRYWFSELIGLDVGIGLGFFAGNIDDGVDTIPADNGFAMTIHGGAPIALFHAEHYVLLVVPEVNIGFSTGTIFGATQDQDRGRSGFLFQVGARIGGEIHFGFMDIPQLSLQASVGLYFQYGSAGLGGNRAGARDVGANAFSLETSVQGEPWDIILGLLNALYYF
jgi:hypothetical protein